MSDPRRSLTWSRSDVRHLLNKYCRPPAVRLSSSTGLVAATLRPIIMFRFMHGSTRDCDGVSRRDFFRVGGLGLAGMTLADLLRLETRAATPPTARSVILLWMQGGPSHIDTLDPKPEAPAEIRGEFGVIPTVAARGPDLRAPARAGAEPRQADDRPVGLLVQRRPRDRRRVHALRLEVLAHDGLSLDGVGHRPGAAREPRDAALHATRRARRSEVGRRAGGISGERAQPVRHDVRPELRAVQRRRDHPARRADRISVRATASNARPLRPLAGARRVPGQRLRGDGQVLREGLRDRHVAAGQARLRPVE